LTTAVKKYMLKKQSTPSSNNTSTQCRGNDDSIAAVSWRAVAA